MTSPPTVASTPATPAPGVRGERRRRRRNERLVVRLVAVLAAVGAATAGAHPTGLAVADAAFTAAFAALVVLAARRARRWTWFACAGLAAITASGWSLVPGFGALALACVAASFRRRPSWIGALVTALAIQALMRMGSIGFHGSTAVLAALATVPVLVSSYRLSPRRIRKRVRRTVLGLAAVAAVVVGAFAVAVLLARQHVEDGIAQSRSALDAARDGETDEAEGQLASAVTSFDAADSFLGSWWVAPARAVPVVGHQAKALALLSEDGLELSRTSRDTVEEADYDRVRYASGRFDLDVVRGLRRPLERVAAALGDVDAGFDEARSPWLLAPLADRIDRFAGQVDDARPDAELAADAVALAPDMLGGNGPRRYFVAFVTPAELRGSGGFIGSYGELTAIDGRVRLTRSGPIRELTRAAPPGTRTLSGPADYLARYGRYDPADFFQDVTYSPDFPSDAQVIEQLYPQSGGAQVDGVLSVDPYALGALLEFTGPIAVEGLPDQLTSDNAADVLLRDQYLLFDKGADDDALTDAASATFDELTTGSLPGPRRVADVLSPMVREGRLLMHATRGGEQALFERIGFDGALPAPDGHDFLSVVAQNSGNSKIDVFLRRRIEYRARFDPASGEIQATARITLENDAPASGLPRYVIGNSRGLPNGTSSLLVSVYTPHRLESATVDGQPVAVESQEELGHRVYDRFLEIPPGGAVTFELELRGTLSAGRYELALASQPTVNPDRLVATVAPADGWRIGSTRGATIADGRVRMTGRLAEDARLEAAFER
jgi:hypothetical protein